MVTVTCALLLGQSPQFLKWHIDSLTQMEFQYPFWKGGYPLQAHLSCFSALEVKPRYLSGDEATFSSLGDHHQAMEAPAKFWTTARPLTIESCTTQLESYGANEVVMTHVLPSGPATKRATHKTCHDGTFATVLEDCTASQITLISPDHVDELS